MRECNSFLSPICIPVSVSTHQNCMSELCYWAIQHIITTRILIMLWCMKTHYIDNNNSSPMFITLRFLFNITIYYHRNIRLSSPIIITVIFVYHHQFILYITRIFMCVYIYTHTCMHISPLQTFTIYFKKLNILLHHFNYF